MKRYRDLDLAGLCERTGLDFAHYTYPRGKSYLEFHPWDFPRRYWRNNEINYDFDFTFLIIKNSKDLNRYARKKDFIEDETYFDLRAKDEVQFEAVLLDLQNQLGNEYRIVRPTDPRSSNVIRCISR